SLVPTLCVGTALATLRVAGRTVAGGDSSCPRRFRDAERRDGRSHAERGNERNSMSATGDYLKATRHPWPCSLFLLPLLLAYEVGVHYLGGAHPEVLRNGADSWLRQGLAVLGMRQHFWAPALLVAILLLWNSRRMYDRPGDHVGVLSGMAIESIAFALGLWG